MKTHYLWNPAETNYTPGVPRSDKVDENKSCIIDAIIYCAELDAERPEVDMDANWKTRRRVLPDGL